MKRSIVFILSVIIVFSYLSTIVYAEEDTETEDNPSSEITKDMEETEDEKDTISEMSEEVLESNDENDAILEQSESASESLEKEFAIYYNITFVSGDDAVFSNGEHTYTKQVSNTSKYFYLPSVESLDYHKKIYGWSREKDGEVEFYADSPTPVYTPSRDETWYAIYEEVFIITIHAGEDASITYNNRSEYIFQLSKGDSINRLINVNHNDPHKVFSGWSDTEDGDVIIGTQYDFRNHIPVSDETWYPVWSDSFIITLNAGEGYFTSDKTVKKRTINVLYGREISHYSLCSDLHHEDSGGVVFEWVGDDGTHLGRDDSIIPQNDICFDAVWKNERRITLNYGEGYARCTYGYDTQRKYHTLKVYEGEKLDASADAQSDPNDYPKFNYLEVNTEYGYYLYGWTTDLEKGREYESIMDYVAGKKNETLYAIIKKKPVFKYDSGEYGYFYKDQYGKESTLESYYHIPGKDLSIPIPKECVDKFYFLGWSLTRDGSGGIISPEDYIDCEEDLTFYAQYVYAEETIITCDVREPIKLVVGSTFQLPVTIEPNAYFEGLQFSSFDESIASVDENGIISAKTPGNVIIKITEVNSVVRNGRKYISVIVGVNPESISYENKVRIMMPGDNYPIAPIIKPESVIDNSILYTSSNTNIIQIDKYNHIQAVRSGVAVLTAETVNGLTAECKITVLFNDVTIPTQYYYDAVYWAVDKGITQGNSSTTFNPSGFCKRYQFVLFLWRQAGSPEPAMKEDPFTDVTSDPNKDAYEKAVLWAAEKGYTTGTTPTTFDPYAPLTRGQVVTFLYRAAGEPEVTTTANPFKDLDSSKYYYTPVLWAVEKEITTGLNATQFGPTNTCTRGQTVLFMYRMFK